MGTSFYGGRSGTNVSVSTEEKYNLHILNGESHTTNQERALWNDKITVVYDDENDTIIFSKAREI